MSISKILVVDDSSTERTNLTGLLENEGYIVENASSGADAVTAAKAHHPDLIFMDIIMDDVDGYQACRQILGDDETKDIPIIFVSSKNQKADKVWARSQGAKGYVTKPWEKSDILMAIAQIA